MIDYKEQVIEFELTDKGKENLADGLLDFSFYSFSDEDIMYDASYASLPEPQNQAQSRILDTPRVNLNSRTEGATAELKRVDGAASIQSEMQKTFSPSIMLGGSDPSNNLSPRWDLTTWSGTISGSSNVYEDQDRIFYARVPQVNMDIHKYTVSKITKIPEEVIDELAFAGLDHTLSDGVGVTEDGTILELVEKDLFIEIDEINSIFNNTNFDLEVFEVVETRDSKGLNEFLTPLYFSNKPRTQSDIFIEEVEPISDVTIDSSMVENFFIIEVDGEIDPDIVCARIPADKRRGIYDPMYYDCEERAPYRLKFDPQNSATADEETDMEEC